MLKKATSGVLSRSASSRTGVRSGGFAPSGLAGGLFDHPVVFLWSRSPSKSTSKRS